MKKVYIACAYTKGDPCLNVRSAVFAADRLLDAGYAPLVPILSHLWHLISPHDYETWMRLDLEWLPCCDALVRLPGESSGADREVAEARRLGIPVFMGVDAFLESPDEQHQPRHDAVQSLHAAARHVQDATNFLANHKGWESEWRQVRAVASEIELRIQALKRPLELPKEQE
jgi:hypothetical protein